MDKSRKVIFAACLGAAFLAGVCACSIEDANLEKPNLFVCKTIPGCMTKSTVTVEGTEYPKGTCLSNEDYGKTGAGACDADMVCAATVPGTCLAGSVCVAIDPTHNEGKCVPADKVVHCHDNDKDQFYGADPGYEDTCGFTESSPRDCNDADRMVNPKATEFCDGIDNTCDGCIDGTCPAGKDCVTNPSECLPLVELCLGSGTPKSMRYYEQNNISHPVCSPTIAGVKFCSRNTNKKTVWAKCISGECEKEEDFELSTNETDKCPIVPNQDNDWYELTASGESFIFTYDESKTSDFFIKNEGIYRDKICNGQEINRDHDCDGVDASIVCGQTCTDTNIRCFWDNDTMRAVEVPEDDDLIKEAYEAAVGCQGKMLCEEGSGVGFDSPSCRFESSRAPVTAECNKQN